MTHDDDSGTSRRELLRRTAVAALGVAWFEKFGSTMPAFGMEPLDRLGVEPTKYFPPAGQFVIPSHPVFAVSNPDFNETLIFDATMHVSTGDPFVNDQGTRQVDITVDKWVASAESKVFGPVSVRLAPVAQPPSYVISNAPAGSDASDFPALLHFEMITDYSAMGQTIRDHGTATGTVRSFPPRGEMFQVMHDAAAFRDVLAASPEAVTQILGVLCACS